MGPEKNTANIKKHGIDFEDAKVIFDGDVITNIDNRGRYGEDRYISIGLMFGICVVVVHTDTQNNIRIISARKATKHEEKEYFKAWSGQW